jgi:signal transduction histidine kinase
MYALLLLVIAAPLFYVITESMYIEDADEALMLRKEEFFEYYDSKIHQNDITSWNRLNRDNKILEWNGLAADSLFYKNYFDTLHNEFEPYRELNFPITIDNTRYLYSARINLVESEDLIESIVWLFSFIVLLLITGIFLISRRLFITLWRPFYSTLEKIEKFELDKTELPVLSSCTTEEFQRLNEAFDLLITRNLAAFKNQKEFLENAAHELQTPLAVLQSKVDSLLQIENLTNDQAEAIDGVHSSISKLNRINKNLLLLSRIEYNGNDFITKVNIRNILDANGSFFMEQAAQRNITIEITAQVDFVVNANTYLVESLVNNLIMNAIKHNFEGGFVVVTLNNQRLIVSNSSQDNELTREKLFQRFSKQGQETSGTGLGLSIIKKITDLFEWTICYEYRDNMHLFIVDFENSKFLQSLD